MPKWSKDQIGSTFPTRRSPGEVSKGTKVLRAVFGLLGIAAAIAAGFWMYDRTDSVWPAIFVGFVVLQLLARAIPDLITEPKRIRRACYFALGPGVASAVFYFTYQWWETYWLAFVLAVLGGGLLVAILAPLLFPSIHREEQADNRRRWGVADT